MIGIGKWKCSLDIALFRTEAIIEISDNNGEYGFNVLGKAGEFLPDYVIESVEEQGEDSLRVVMRVPALYGERPVVVHSTYTDDEITGFLKFPIIGRIQITDGRRVPDDYTE